MDDFATINALLEEFGYGDDTPDTDHDFSDELDD